MENYTIEIKLNTNEEFDDEDIGYEIPMELLFKQNNIEITSFYMNFKYFYEIFINKFDQTKNEDCFELYNCNGSVIITKKNNYLIFETSIFSGCSYGLTSFTVLITDEIFTMIEKVKIIKQNLK